MISRTGIQYNSQNMQTIFFMSFRITRLVNSYDSFTHILQDCFIDTTNIHYFISYTIWWAYNDDEKIIFIYWRSVSYWLCLRSGPWFNIKMSSYQYRKSHCGDKTILRPSYVHNILVGWCLYIESGPWFWHHNRLHSALWDLAIVTQTHKMWYSTR